MPKEIIYDRYFDETARSHPDCDHPMDVESMAVCPGTLVRLATGGIKVGWTKEREHLEVAVIKDATGDPDGMDEKPWHIQLDRRGCNALIRQLRRAGRQAFGSDEW